MSMIIRRVAKGGMPVTEALNGRGAPYVESPRGVPVTFVAKGGIPLRQGVGVTYERVFGSGFGLFEFTDNTRIYTTNNGPTLCSAVGDAIGLAVDVARRTGETIATMMAAQANLLVGAFTTSVAGGSSTAVESPAGTITLSPDGTNQARADKSFATIIGKLYRVQATLAGGSTGFRVGNSLGGTSIVNTTMPSNATTALYFVATATITWVRFDKTAVAATVVSAIEAKEVPAAFARQATAGSRPTFQMGDGGIRSAARFATDDALSSNILPTAQGFIQARVKLTGGSGVRTVIGSNGASGTSRCVLFFNSAGKAACRIGSGAEIAAGADLTGTVGTIALEWDGSTVDLIINGEIVASAAQSGAPDLATAFALGATNANGTNADFLTGDIADVLIASVVPAKKDLRGLHNLMMEQSTKIASFGFFTDLHAGDGDTTDGLSRYYRDAGSKLGVAVSTWSAQDLDFILFNGDLADEIGGTSASTLTSLQAIEAVYATVSKPRYYLHGNHPLGPNGLTKEQILANTAMGANYKSFDVGGMRFIILDCCFDSDDDTRHYSPTSGWDYQNSYIPPAQRAWLVEQMATAPSRGCMIFCHYKLNVGGANRVLNSSVVLDLIHAAGNCRAIFTGHSHDNTFAFSTGGVPRYGMEAMTDDAFPANAYATVTVFNDFVRIVGYGGQSSYA